MPTPVREILNRKPFPDDAAPVIVDILTPLTHVVNLSTRVLTWLETDKECHSFCSAAASLFLRKMAMLADGIDVLLRPGATEASVHLQRPLLEAYFYLRYVLGDDRERRSKCYLFHQFWQRKLDSNGQCHESFADIAEEWKKYQGDRRNWYSLFSGPRNLRSLARTVERLALYDDLYRMWSGNIHAGDGSYGVLITDHPKPGTRPLRLPGDLESIAWTTATLMLYACDDVVNCLLRSRSDEYGHDRWMDVVLPLTSRPEAPRITINLQPVDLWDQYTVGKPASNA